MYTHKTDFSTHKEKQHKPAGIEKRKIEACLGTGLPIYGEKYRQNFAREKKV